MGQTNRTTDTVKLLAVNKTKENYLTAQIHLWVVTLLVCHHICIYTVHLCTFQRHLCISIFGPKADLPLLYFDLICGKEETK